jgi:hypothetical protein
VKFALCGPFASGWADLPSVSSGTESRRALVLVPNLEDRNMYRPCAGFRFPLLAVCAALVLGLVSGSTSYGQIIGGGFAVNNVGGVYVDAEGLLHNIDADTAGKLRDVRQQALQDVPADLSAYAPLRKVSLARLSDAIRAHVENNTPLTEDVLYLAGLQRIEYVLIYPETQDIVLAGPAEGWRNDKQGNVVGLTTGQPVMVLDDLLVALRAAHAAQKSVMSCSIDPTPEGTRRLQQLFSQLTGLGPRPQQTMKTIEETLGPQVITLTGVPESSHLARVLVAADYRMKRLAMNFEKSPVSGMPSYLTLVKSSTAPEVTTMPRWWLAPDYQPLLADQEGLAFELRGANVKVMTEDDFIAANGTRQGTGQSSALAQKWADSMTERFGELAKRLPIFGQLQNVMDLAIVAALIEREGLSSRAGCDLSLLQSEQELPTVKLPAPQQVPTQASYVSRRKDYVISASGGVQVNQWAEVERCERTTTPMAAREQSERPTSAAWWWN